MIFKCLHRIFACLLNPMSHQTRVTIAAWLHCKLAWTRTSLCLRLEAHLQASALCKRLHLFPLACLQKPEPCRIPLCVLSPPLHVQRGTQTGRGQGPYGNGADLQNPGGASAAGRQGAMIPVGAQQPSQPHSGGSMMPVVPPSPQVSSGHSAPDPGHALNSGTATPGWWTSLSLVSCCIWQIAHPAKPKRGCLGHNVASAQSDIRHRHQVQRPKQS